MPAPLPTEVDVLVYGATAGGVAAAIAAAEEGARTLLVGDNPHVGGMVSGGLGKTDIERGERLIGGFAARFFAAVGSHYGEGPAYRFEPSVAEATFRSLLASAGVTVISERSLDDVEREGLRIVAARFGDAAVSASTFIDASYEGDLLRAAGISHAIGREAATRMASHSPGASSCCRTHTSFARRSRRSMLPVSSGPASVRTNRSPRSVAATAWCSPTATACA